MSISVLLLKVAMPPTISPLASLVNEIAVIEAPSAPFVPAAPGSPFSPWIPCAPVSPFSPLRFLKENANVLADVVPPAVTVTDGVPTLESTVAVTPVIVAFVPFVPLAPSLPATVSIKPASMLDLSESVIIRWLLLFIATSVTETPVSP